MRLRVHSDKGYQDVRTNIGLIQGGSSSCHLFNLVLDPLIRALNRFTTAIAFADDVVVVIENISMLHRVIETINTEARKVGLSVNKKKSGLMPIVNSAVQIHPDLRQPNAEIAGIPVVKSYKYLGLEIDYLGGLKNDLAKKRQLEKQLKDKKWILRSTALTASAKMQIWHSLFNSKVSYGMHFLVARNKQA
jgi:Reverse transcriptase (RNA-dependent DNA polymerase).